MNPSRRFVDTRESIYDMMDEILVVCPRCQACARVFPQETQGKLSPGYFQDRRVVCSGCGFSKDWSRRSLGFDWDADPMCDSYFGLPLWLQAPCCGHTLWAYNRRHLDLLEAYIGADLRERERDPEWGWSNASLTNRLPEWMLIAKHRETILRTVAKLKTRLRVA